MKKYNYTIQLFDEYKSIAEELSEIIKKHKEELYSQKLLENKEIKELKKEVNLWKENYNNILNNNNK